MALQGGCQCRKIRYTVEFDEAKAVKNFCHCRMCQLATGSPVGAFFTVQEVRQSATQLAALLKSQRPVWMSRAPCTFHRQMSSLRAL